CAKLSKTKLEFEDWLIQQFATAFHIPSNTPKELICSIRCRLTRILGACTDEDCKDIRLQRMREENLLILKPTSHVSDKDLSTMCNAVLEGVSLESPDKPTSWELFY
ncbi:MAG TPA: hypothetical protein V6C72_05280, partial [Chroococcales cyanobacterium]